MFGRRRDQTFRVGDRKIRLSTPRSMPESDTGAMPVFDLVWPSGPQLANYLLNVDLDGKRVLDLGCGLGLVALSLGSRQVDITAMDIHPAAAEFLHKNARRNKVRLSSVVTASWAEPPRDLGQFDLVLASDVLYEPRQFSSLPGFLATHVRPGGQAFIVDPDRGMHQAFLDGMTGHFERVVPTPAWTGDGTTLFAFRRLDSAG